MSARTKIVVLHMKEVIYTVIFVILAIILGVVLFFMFGPAGKRQEEAQLRHRFKPGIYSTSVVLNDNTFDIEVTVDSDRIKAVGLKNLSETTTAMFPLMEPSLESLASQIYVNQSLEGITYPEEHKYTSLLLIHSIETALKKAEN